MAFDVALRDNGSGGFDVALAGGGATIERSAAIGAVGDVSVAGLFFTPAPAIDPTGTLLPWLMEQPVRQTLAWHTDIIKGRKGHEHRASRRTAPHESFSADYLLDVPQLRYLRAKLVNDGADLYLIPLRWLGLLGTADLAHGGLIVTVGTTTLSDWAVDGHRVLVEEETTGAQLVTHIVDVAAGSLMLDAAPSTGPNPWRASRFRVYPLVAVHVADGAPAGYYPVAVGKWELQASRKVSVAPTGAGATVVTFDGHPVLDRRPPWRELAQETPHNALRFVDYGGVATVAIGVDRGDVVRVHDFSWRTEAGRQWWLKFFATVKGRRKAFLLPTWLDDLTVHTQPTTADLVVFGDTAYSDTYRGNFMADWQSSTGHDWIQLEMSDGTLLYREITGAVNNGDGTQTLTMNAAVDTSGGAPDVVRISYMELCRLEDDAVNIQHFVARSEFRLALRVVQQ